MATALKLLHVEDDDGDAAIIRRALVKEFHADCVLTRVRSLCEAIDSIKECQYDAVLLDLSLGDARGIENVRALREVCPDLPIVVLTGTDNNEVALSAVRSGAQEYMVKDHSSSRSMSLAVLSSIERKSYERSLFRQANHDELTGLPNRRMFTEYLERSLIRAGVWRRSEAILFLDLDNFKMVNDTYGHDAGDLVLRASADRIRASMRPSDLVARFAGDEFVIHLDGPAHVSREACIEVARRIKETFDEPLSIGDRRIAIRISIGIALYPENATDVASLIHQADLAMYRAKREKTHFAIANMETAPPHGSLTLITRGKGHDTRSREMAL